MGVCNVCWRYGTHRHTTARCAPGHFWEGRGAIKHRTFAPKNKLGNRERTDDGADDLQTAQTEEVSISLPTVRPPNKRKRLRWEDAVKWD